MHSNRATKVAATEAENGNTPALKDTRKYTGSTGMYEWGGCNASDGRRGKEGSK